MPFYNGNNTVIRALDSIYEMSLPLNEFEVIIVDDCSPILAIDVLNEYKKTHPNIRVVRHPNNTRQGGAKNTGISLAKGKYIALIDQDDLINPINMHLAISKALENNVDVISCYYSILHKNGQLQEIGINYPESNIVTGAEFCETYYNTHDSIGPWSYLYKTDYLRTLNRPMKENVLLEDPDWTIWHLIHAKRMCFLDQPIYVWVMNNESITHSTDKYQNRVDWIKAGIRKIDDAKNYQNIAPSFAAKIIVDGKWNIKGGFRRLWKVNNYYAFYKNLGALLNIINKMEWHGITYFYIHHPYLAMILLYLLEY
jgi:glycosyltransferase involved in cell wall biosynthesis